MISERLYFYSVPLESERELGFVSAMRDKLSQKHYNLVMCVLTTHRADIYNSIKRLTLCEMGIPSQVHEKFYDNRRQKFSHGRILKILY